MTIISGHQRHKACIDLDIKTIPAIIREGLIDDDEKIRQLIAANFGRIEKNNEKFRKAVVTYVELNGKKLGDNQWVDQNDLPKKSQVEIASEVGISIGELKRLMQIEKKLTPEMQKYLDTGKMTKKTALTICKELSKEEQTKLLKELASNDADVRVDQNDLPKKQEIENLSQDMVVSNYKEMCELLGETPGTGKSKQIQLREWERYFNHEKMGNKFIITKIYHNTKPKLSKALYTKFIELLLMYELSIKEGHTCQYTKTNMFHILGMANQYYLKNNRCLVSDEISGIPNWQVNHFYMRSNQKLTEILFAALNNMKKRKLLSYYELRIICENKEHRVASDVEEKQILKVERDVLTSMGYEKVPFLKIDEYYSKVNAKLSEIYGWEYTYKEYKLIFNSDQILNDIPTVKNEFTAEIIRNRLELNSKILEAMNKQAQYYYDKNCKEYKGAFLVTYPPKTQIKNKFLCRKLD